MRYVPGACGGLLIGTGLLHTAAGAALWRPQLRAIARDGVVDAVDPNPARQAAFWFMMTGWSWIAVGQAVAAHERRVGAPPPALGRHLLGIGAVGAALMPRSGFWLFLPQGVLALALARRAARATAVDPPTSPIHRGGQRPAPIAA